MPEENKLVVYTSHKEEVYAPIIKEFEERTGIWVELHTGGTSELLEEIAEGNGEFTSRSQLLKVAKLGPKAYEQCAGFMRITGGENPLDATGVHPESYDAAKQLLEKLGLTNA